MCLGLQLIDIYKEYYDALSMFFCFDTLFIERFSEFFATDTVLHQRLRRWGMGRRKRGVEAVMERMNVVLEKVRLPDRKRGWKASSG